MSVNKGEYIKKTIERIRENKAKKKQDFDNIKYSILKPKSSLLGTPFMRELYPREDLSKKDLKDITKDTIHIDKDYVRKDIKRKLRFAWKDPGYCNEQFGKNMPLPNRVSYNFLFFKVLSEWERERCIMPERSYKYVPGKGNFRMDHYTREFGIKYPKEMCSENFQSYLQTFEKKFSEFVLRPTKFGRIKENDTLDRIVEASKKEVWRDINTVQNESFGFNRDQQTKDFIRKKSKKFIGKTKLPKI